MSELNIKFVFENTNSILYLELAISFRYSDGKITNSLHRDRSGIVARIFYESAQHDSALSHKTGTGEQNTISEDKGGNVLPGCRAALRIGANSRTTVPCNGRGR